MQRRYADDIDTDGLIALAAMPGDGAPPYVTVLSRLQQEAGKRFQAFELRNPTEAVEGWLRERGRALIGEHNDLAVTASEPQIEGDIDEIVRRMISEIIGLGGIEDLLLLDGVEDIAVNGPNEVCVKRFGRWEFHPEVTYPDSQSLLNRLNHWIAHTGRQAGPLLPIVDAHLQSGHRINIVTSPIAEPWPVAVIRKRGEAGLTMMDLVQRGGGARGKPEPVKIPRYWESATSDGVFTGTAAFFLHMAVAAGMNILVVGATGVGKTTLLGALGKMIPEDRRILVIEDTRELSMREAVDGRPRNCVYFTTRAETVEGVKAVAQDQLVRAALRQRPDALTLGEARGAEVFDLLKAMWTGHRNGLTSIHAESIAEVPGRIKMMMQEAQLRTGVSNEEVSEWIAKAFHLGITLRLTSDGRRVVDDLIEFTGIVEGRRPGMNVLFTNDGVTLKLAATRRELYHEDMLSLAGYSFNMVMEAERRAGD